MLLKSTPVIGLLSLGLVGFSASPTLADVFDYINISSYANNNIYTDLNQNFPNTGPGMPGSHTGTPSATFLFSPSTYTPPAAAGTGVPYTSYSAPLGNNGVNFQLNSNSAGQDFAQIGTSGPSGYTGPNPLTVNIGVSDVTTVYALMAAYNGESFSVTFNGTGGTETFSNVFVPDFFNGTSNTCTTSLCVQTVYDVVDQGGGGTGNSATGGTGTYDLTEVAFTLNPALSVGQLTSATFTSNGYETLLFGLTTRGPGSVPSPVPEPASMILFGTALAGLGLLSRGRRSH
jgi:PEP-CTERM motif-containing protein